MSAMFLSSEEVQELTCRIQRAAQVKVLRGMGIEHRQRPDGTLAVLRAHVEKVFGAAPAAARKTAPKEPDWGALDAARA
ncbi:MAG: DUF4224 domain-containing protein [Telluria sp.]